MWVRIIVANLQFMWLKCALHVCRTIADTSGNYKCMQWLPKDLGSYGFGVLCFFFCYRSERTTVPQSFLSIVLFSLPINVLEFESVKLVHAANEKQLQLVYSLVSSPTVHKKTFVWEMSAILWEGWELRLHSLSSRLGGWQQRPQKGRMALDWPTTESGVCIHLSADLVIIYKQCMYR